VTELLSNNQRLRQMGAAVATLGVRDADQRIAEAIAQLP